MIYRLLVFAAVFANQRKQALRNAPAGAWLALDLAERSSGGLGEHKQQATSNIQHRDTTYNTLNTRPGVL
jgi:hypothetical protein